MTVLKDSILKALSALGYELVRSSGPRVSLDNFANLARAYEQRLNDENNVILPNENRAKLLARLTGTPPSKAYFIIQALAKCKDVSGDVCEFGVAQGETSALIGNEIAPYTWKRLHLFDSFQGLSKPSAKDRLIDDIFSLGSIEAYAGTMACPETMVRTRLEMISFPTQRYVIHKGLIEQLIHIDKKLPKEVCLAYVDFDFYEPIRTTLHFLHETTPTGAIIIVDDYDFFSTGAKIAVDEFIEEKNSRETVYECTVPNPRYGHLAVLTRVG